MPARESIFQSVRKLYRLSNPYRTRLIGAILLSMISAAIWLVVPMGLKSLLDAVFDNTNRSMLNTIAIGLALLFALQAVVNVLGSYGLRWTGERIVIDLRARLYRHIHSLDLQFFQNHRVGEITSRLTNDIASIRDALTNTAKDAITQTLTLTGAIVLMVYLNWRLSLAVFATVPLVTISSRYYGRKIRGLSRGVQDKLADTTTIAEEVLTAITVVKSFVRETFEITRYEEALESLFETARKKALLTSVYWALIGLGFMWVMAFIFWFGGREVLNGRLTAGDLVAFIFYAMTISRSVSAISSIYTTLSSAVGATERIYELLDMKSRLSSPDEPKQLEDVRGEITFNDVSFAYNEDTPVLKAIDARIPAGTTTALVGPSGAGKTTFTHLIPRFYDVTSGTICVDGYDLRALELADLRGHIGIVTQDVQLFGTTILDNIRYGNLQATRSEIEDAARAANAHDFICELPEGYETQVGERGVKLSGGQRQRVAIARAILQNPPILLLDEATSSLDSESEKLVQEALESLKADRTTVVVAHRFSTILNADQILVLQNGEIVERGSHEILMQQSGLYRELYELQFSEGGTTEKMLQN